MGEKATGQARTVGLWEPGVMSELKRKITPALYCEVLDRNLEHNFKKCPQYKPVQILSRTTRAISYQGSPGRPRPERKEELHYCVLCQHSKSLKDRSRS